MRERRWCEEGALEFEVEGRVEELACKLGTLLGVVLSAAREGMSERERKGPRREGVENVIAQDLSKWTGNATEDGRRVIKVGTHGELTSGGVQIGRKRDIFVGCPSVFHCGQRLSSE